MSYWLQLSAHDWARLRTELRSIGADSRGMLATLDTQITKVLDVDHGSGQQLPHGWGRTGMEAHDGKL